MIHPIMELRKHIKKMKLSIVFMREGAGYITVESPKLSLLIVQ